MRTSSRSSFKSRSNSEQERTLQASREICIGEEHCLDLSREFSIGVSGRKRSESVLNSEGSESATTMNTDEDYSLKNDHIESSVHHSLLASCDSQNNIDEEDDEELGPATVRMCQEALEDPAIVALTEGKDLDTLAPFDIGELDLGEFLGRGEFCNVFEIQSFTTYSTNVQQKKQEKENVIGETRDFLKANAIRSTGQSRYAIKCLRRELPIVDAQKFKSAARDLAVEAKFLHSIEHPHIIKIRGCASAGAAGFVHGDHDGYFIILDRLCETLHERIYGTWKKQDKKINRSLFGKIRSGITNSNHKRSAKEFLAERLKVAYDISGALYHLHQRNIIYRDLKPDNLGFDVRGDIKLFDFGLAKQLPDDIDMNEDSFEMSDAGSMRYMAPEVLVHEPYNLKADVYSFSMVFWEILSLRKPFRHLTADNFVEKVCAQSERPKIDQKRWPSPIQDAIIMSWECDLSERPPMMIVQNILRYQVMEMSESTDESALDHQRRRSMGSIGTVEKSAAFSRSLSN